MRIKNMLRHVTIACALFAAGNSLAQTTRGLAYVANNGVPGSVSVIDNATATLAATIPVGNGPTRIIASPDNTRVYVSNSLSASVSVISTLTTGGAVSNTVLQTVAVGNNPGFMSISPDGSMVFVSNQNDNTISAINTSTFATTTIALSGTGPRNLTVTANGLWVYVGYTTSTSMSVISTATLTEVATVPVGSPSRYIAGSPDGSQIYVSLPSLDEVGVIDTATMTLVATPPSGLRPNGLAITPDGSQVFSANLGAGVDAANGSLVGFTTSNDVESANVTTGALTWQAVVSHDGKTVYTASSEDKAVYAVDIASQTLKQVIPVGTGPYWTTVSDPDGVIYCTNPAAGTISVVNSVTYVTLATIPVGGTPWSSVYVNGPVVDGTGAAPQVNSVVPTSIAQGASVSVAVGGANFESGASLTIAGAAAGVTLSNVQYISPTQIDMTINATSAARTGARNLTVTNPDGTTATLTGAFKITASTSGGVSLSSVSPESVARGASVTATIKGSGFESGAGLSFQGAAAGITVSSVTFVSSTQLTATITASPTAIIGPRNLVVTNPDSTTATLVAAFLVSAGTSTGPSITGVAPNSIDPGVTTTATITGTGFESGATLSFAGVAAGVTLSQVTVVSPTQITAMIAVSDRAPAGPRSLTLTNPDSTTATMAAAFEVE